MEVQHRRTLEIKNGMKKENSDVKCTLISLSKDNVRKKNAEKIDFSSFKEKKKYMNKVPELSMHSLLLVYHFLNSTELILPM